MIIVEDYLQYAIIKPLGFLSRDSSVIYISQDA